MQVTYRDHQVELRPQESVLDALLRAGAPISFSCRGGVCHTCMLRCTDGAIPQRAQRGLPQHLRERGYLLPCMCVPEADLVLAPPSGADMVTQCMLLEVQGRGTPFVTLTFETARTLACVPGQRLSAGGTELLVTSEPGAPAMTAVVHCPQGEPAWLQVADFGADFEVCGPLEDEVPPDAASHGGRPPPYPDPALWRELGDGEVVRAVLEAFYTRVYADELLAPYFTGVTKDRAVGKQYAFMRWMFTGERADFVMHPRGSHHWMVIPHALFDHRQAVMVETLRQHGLDAAQIARWTRVEEHYRSDIVKTAPWPRLIDGKLVNLEAFAWDEISVASVCDYCGGEVEAGTRVRYHLRLGHLCCPACTPAGAAEVQAGVP